MESTTMPSISSKLSSRIQGIEENHIFHCISTMLRQEEQYICHDYLEDAQSLFRGDYSGDLDNSIIDETCRSKMCEWIFHVIDSTRLQRETASVAMNFLDRFLCASTQRAERARTNRSEYQLAAMTCMYIAVKIREPVVLDANLTSKLSRGLHSPEEITTMEYDILIALNWKVNGPTPLQFVNYILELLPPSAESIAPVLYAHSHFQTELAAGDYAFVPNLRQSSIALASILNSLCVVEQCDPIQLDECIQLVRSISNSLDLDIDSPKVHAIRGRLLKSFTDCNRSKSNVLNLPSRRRYSSVTGVAMSL